MFAALTCLITSPISVFDSGITFLDYSLTQTKFVFLFFKKKKEKEKVKGKMYLIIQKKKKKKKGFSCFT